MALFVLVKNDDCAYVDFSKTLQQLSDSARGSKLSMLKTAAQICDNRIPDINLSAKRELTNFVKVIQKLKRFSSEACFLLDYLKTGLKLATRAFPPLISSEISYNA